MGKKRATIKVMKSADKWHSIYILAVFAVMLIVFIGLSIRNALRPAVPPMSSAKTTSTTVTSEDLRVTITRAVAKRMLLPEGLPIVERLDDVRIYRSIHPAFYKDAMAGDWVLRYPSIAILYRASSDLIVATMPVAKTGATSTFGN